MTQLKHTPGPWESSASVDSDDYTPAHVRVNGNDGLAAIADCFYGKSDSERLANARLIAACPEMLAALRDCQQAILDIIGAADNGQPYSADELAGFAAESAEKARAAIAKATSEQ